MNSRRRRSDRSGRGALRSPGIYQQKLEQQVENPLWQNEANQVNAVSLAVRHQPHLGIPAHLRENCSRPRTTNAGGPFRRYFLIQAIGREDGNLYICQCACSTLLFLI